MTRKEANTVSCPPDDLLTLLRVPLAQLDVTDPATLRKLLLADKMQLTEGLVGEYLLDRIIDRMHEHLLSQTADADSAPEPLSHGRSDTETFIISPQEKNPKWIACIFSRDDDNDPLLLQYLRALRSAFEVILIRWHDTHPHLRARSFEPEHADSEEALSLRMQRLSGLGDRRTFTPAGKGQGSQRHKDACRFLIGRYGDQLLKRVVLPRIIVNSGIQPWFTHVWNIDRVMLIRNCLWAFEVKHKYPFGEDPGPFRFGINDGQLLIMQRLAACHIHYAHLILANPYWDIDAGASHLATGEKEAYERTELIAKTLDDPTLGKILRRKRYYAPDYTRVSEKGGQLAYRRLSATEFTDLGKLGVRGARRLGEQLANFLAGEPLPRLTDELLLERRIVRVQQIRQRG
jgi:hypothetical protein